MSDTQFLVLRTVYPSINTTFPGLISERHDPNIVISSVPLDPRDILSDPVSVYLYGVSYVGGDNTDSVMLLFQSIDFYLSVQAWPKDAIQITEIQGAFNATVKTDAAPSLIYQYNKSLQKVPVLLRLSEEFIA